jgi:hypothetical protein
MNCITLSARFCDKIAKAGDAMLSREMMVHMDAGRAVVHFASRPVAS